MLRHDTYNVIQNGVINLHIISMNYHAKVDGYV